MASTATSPRPSTSSIAKNHDTQVRPPAKQSKSSSRSKAAVQTSDEALLAELGYKQEFKREFTSLEVSLPSSLLGRREIPSLIEHLRDQVFGVAFSIIGLLPSIASVLFNAIPIGGPVAMVWGVSDSSRCIKEIVTHCTCFILALDGLPR